MPISNPGYRKNTGEYLAVGSMQPGPSHLNMETSLIHGLGCGKPPRSTFQFRLSADRFWDKYFLC